MEGYGRSDKKRDINFDIANGVDDLVAATDYIAKTRGIMSFMVYGISSGALRAALPLAGSMVMAGAYGAVTGLVVTPLIVLGLIAWACWSWLRYGRDPEVADDPSVLMPDPPPGLTPAAAATSQLCDT